MRSGALVLLSAAFLICGGASCVQSTKITQEYINAPVNLTMSLVGTQTYQVSFFSDNREGNFGGYGIFTGSSAAALNTAIDDMPVDISAAQAFCTIGAQATYGTRVAIQIGPAAAGVAAGTALCDITTLTLTSGSYIALRARVERTSRAWSAAAIVQVP